MENLVAKPATPSIGRGLVDAAFWRGRRVLVTGHTGFIGGWTCAWLHMLGAKVAGYALDPPSAPSFFELCRMNKRVDGTISDIRYVDVLDRVVATTNPDIVLHLAARPIVSEGYRTPREMFDVNMMGTVNVLESVRRHGASAVVVMTSDKVYRTDEDRAHREEDRLGAADPYSTSKACCELAVEAYSRAFYEKSGIGLATVRAGNVIGGGDWGADRLVPDAVRAFSAGRPLMLRRPTATRPWQHVLDAASGLLVVAQHVADRREPVGAWNIGPSPGSTLTVRDLAELLAAAWGDPARIQEDETPEFPETEYLALDATRAQSQLSWRSPWHQTQTVSHTVEWYRRALANDDAWSLTARQIETYHADCVARFAPAAAN